MVVVQGFPLILRSPRFENLFGYYGVPPVNPCKRVDGRFAFKVIMPLKPGESSEHPIRSRSLDMVLDVAIYILGLLLLAGGIWLNFGAGWSLTVTGLALLLTAFYNAWVG